MIIAPVPERGKIVVWFGIMNMVVIVVKERDVEENGGKGNE